MRGSARAAAPVISHLSLVCIACISEPFVPVTLRANPNVIFTSERVQTACQKSPGAASASACKRNDPPLRLKRATIATRLEVEIARRRLGPLNVSIIFRMVLRFILPFIFPRILPASPERPSIVFVRVKM